MRCDHNSDDTSVVDRHRFDAIPDPNFHVDADQIRILIRIGFKMMQVFMRILTQISHMLENYNFSLLITACQITMFYLSYQR